MSSLVEEPVATVVCPDPATSAVDERAYMAALHEVLVANHDALRTSEEDLDAFLEILMAADAEYIETPAYAVPQPLMPLDWESVSMALSESQNILIGVQQLLAETLSAMGVEDSEYVRIYAEENGALRLTSDHPRRAEIEAVLNSSANAELRNLYKSAVAGMSLAGGLVGTMALPPEVAAKIAADHSAA